MAVLPLSAPARCPARVRVGPPPGRLTHRVPALFTVLLGVLLTLVVPATAAYAGPDEGTFTAGANGARAGSGLPAYRVAADLVAVARGQAQRMAGEGRLYHNPNLASEVRGWSFVGENVGVGPSAQAIQNAFMASPSHRSNILDRDFTEIGVGTAVGAD
ncbi:MAG: CAP domain-containing protein, partial [Actinomycetota bacterium]